MRGKAGDQFVPICHGGITPACAGKRYMQSKARLNSRITPACAGKRTVQVAMTAAQKDHPRVCGEKSRADTFSAPSRGSPPRVRGKGSPYRKAGARPRITPACAGKRTHCLPHGQRRQDHPRVCGEKSITEPCDLSSAGSPPRVRGKD